jgi:hypothetical protein
MLDLKGQLTMVSVCESPDENGASRLCALRRDPLFGSRGGAGLLHCAISFL